MGQKDAGDSQTQLCGVAFTVLRPPGYPVSVYLRKPGASASDLPEYLRELYVDLFTRSPAGTFDAILIDVMMPVMGGLTADRTIRTLSRPDAGTIPIIAMTANAFVADAQKCLDAGMNAHPAKPLNIPKVIATIARLCEKPQNPSRE